MNGDERKRRAEKALKAQFGKLVRTTVGTGKFLQNLTGYVLEIGMAPKVSATDVNDVRRSVSQDEFLVEPLPRISSQFHALRPSMLMNCGWFAALAVINYHYVHLTSDDSGTLRRALADHEVPDDVDWLARLRKLEKDDTGQLSYSGGKTLRPVRGLTMGYSTSGGQPFLGKAEPRPMGLDYTVPANRTAQEWIGTLRTYGPVMFGSRNHEMVLVGVVKDTVWFIESNAPSAIKTADFGQFRKNLMANRYTVITRSDVADCLADWLLQDWRLSAEEADGDLPEEKGHPTVTKPADAIAETLRELGLAARSVTPDGNCFHHALRTAASACLGVELPNVKQMRDMMAAHVIANLSDYLPAMGLEEEWAGAVWSDDVDNLDSATSRELNKQVAAILEPGEWDVGLADCMYIIASKTFGLDIQVLTASGLRSSGGGGRAPITLVLRHQHYSATVPGVAAVDRDLL